ncbi:MAG: hypothetical protein A2086_07635 [Spirochaetes bacterium GWD1_27_9]|nr:MAG: hypothetical protein A2Z98_10445 [Spirochaetes bacterium GWB1_27_13]OHD26509.1 MAG: hypothetical protein A2Y34_12920 [Spirochaetes bacterium GWC1_27_15]OHD44802.1 MAG: hypothetical protein A2086_07635 [Spirochaetes bacterium GWD1_27_9]
MEFEKITSNKYSFMDQKNNKNAIIMLRESGTKQVIFVEGIEDLIIYKILYKNYLYQIAFIESKGCDKVSEYLDKSLKLDDSKRYYGIIDRDFINDTERKEKLEKNNRLYIHNFYTLENYLLDYKILSEILKTKDPYLENNLKQKEKKLEEEIKFIIETILKDYLIYGICNWIIKDYNMEEKNKNPKFEKIGYLTIGIVKDKIESSIYHKLKIEENELNRKIEEKNKSLKFQSIDDYHKILSGKKIIHQLRKDVEKIEYLPTINDNDLDFKIKIAEKYNEKNIKIKELGDFIDKIVKEIN